MQFGQLKRRELISLLGGAVAAAWPMTARTQGDRMRRIGVLMPYAADDAESQVRLGAFLQALALSGWSIGQNVSLDIRWAADDPERIRKYAEELASRAPDVILAHANAAVRALLQTTRTVPIVFPVAGDPVGTGLVASLARPGGNVTGFMQFEFGLSGKWLELLKEVAPNVTRAAVLRDPLFGTGTSQFAAIQAVAPLLRMEVTPVNVRDSGEIEADIAAFARSPDGGLIATASAAPSRHRDLLVALTAQHKLPSIYFERNFVVAGGLISYGSNMIDQYRRAASYIDRILKGEKPSDLPVQAPTKYELVINLKTAKALGLEVPSAVLVRADEVIE
jgi:putative ABC transport system substrate-binding protein